MQRSRWLNPAGPQFSWHYLRWVQEAAIGGMESSADIAQALRRRDHRITTSHVTRWRDAHPEFNRVCEDALSYANEVVANVVYQAATAGDLGAARYWLDRRSKPFMPKTKNTMEHTGEGLDDMLRRRATEEAELAASGVFKPAKPRPEFEPGDGYD